MRSFIITSCLLCCAIGCGPAPLPPAGSYSEVTILADGGPAGEWATALAAVLSPRENYFVATEPLFHVSAISAENARDPLPAKTVVLCGVIDAATTVGERITGTLDGETAARVRRGEVSIIRLDDHALQGQLTVIVTAPTDARLREVLRTDGNALVSVIEESCRERLRANLLRDARPDLSDAWERRYGFRLEVPSLYEPYREATGGRGVELHRESPPRVLGVFWTDWVQPPSLEGADDLFAARAALVAARYDGDQMDRERTRFETARLADYPAIRMSGYWYNERYSTAGGFFETYFVWDAGRKQLWIVDLLVYAPGREKTPLVRELRAIAETFRYH